VAGGVRRPEEPRTRGQHGLAHRRADRRVVARPHGAAGPDGQGLKTAPGRGDTMVIISTTPTLEGRPIREYLGIVTGEVIVGANIFKDLFAGIRDIVGGRAGAYEGALRDARREAFEELRYE